MMRLDFGLHLGARQMLAQAAPALWTPANIASGLVRFYTAEDFAALADGVSISSWTDHSSLAQHATQGTATSQPTKQTRNGKPTLQFDGTDDFLQIPGTGLITGAGASYSFVVANLSAPANAFRTALSWGTAAAGQLRELGVNFSRTIQCSLNGTNNDDTASASWAGVDRMVGWLVDPAATSAESTIHIDGVADASFDASGTAINTAAGLGYFGQRTGSTNRWHGGIQAGVILNRAPTTDETQRIEGWAAWAFNRVDLLPADHPNKTAPPTV